MGLPVLTLSPVLAVFSGMVFLIKGGILSGAFYIPSAVLFLTAADDGDVARFAITIFGVASGHLFLRARSYVPSPSRPCGPR